ncbi:DciA family protein [Frateuria hangzhouensis]|uniref:DciA family protein n=1 Tax=Frateuria hangzhouensis TaxID=2995589 RepID=UPI002260EA47|nr:DciA family protein [Frateuria sp. STR12]MCX7514005.1 DciA family protein [Frateuria sp. STR12]
MQRAGSPASHRPARGPKPLADCGSFASLARKAGELDALDRALRQTLPMPLREQVRFAHLRNGRLVFLASSPAWAARLRLMQAQILTTARAIGTSASSVTVKVAPPLPVATEPDRSKPLSPAAAAHLKAAAASITDPELKGLFLELASIAETAEFPTAKD